MGTTIHLESLMGFHLCFEFSIQSRPPHTSPLARDFILDTPGWPYSEASSLLVLCQVEVQLHNFPKLCNHLQRLDHFFCTLWLELFICLHSPSMKHHSPDHKEHRVFVCPTSNGGICNHRVPVKEILQHEYCIAGCRDLIRCLS